MASSAFSFLKQLFCMPPALQDSSVWDKVAVALKIQSASDCHCQTTDSLTTEWSGISQAKQRTTRIKTNLVRMSLMVDLLLEHFCTRSSTLASRAEPNRAPPHSAPVLPFDCLEGDTLGVLPPDSAECDWGADSESEMEASIGERMLLDASCSS